VIEAARQSFASVGYAATTIRRVAADAGVDPSLVMQFHGSKRGLFLNAMALPLDTAEVIAALAAGPRRQAGARLADWFVGRVWDDPAVRTILVGRVRAAATEPEGAALVREQIADDIVVPLLRALDADRIPLRASLVSSVLIGVVMTRWVIGVEALSDRSEVAALIAPVLTGYLVGPLPI
jgi:AcrR family transcriptional regulator